MTVLTGGSSSYLLLDKLGEGNFSSVFKAQCLGPRRGSASCCPVAARTNCSSELLRSSSRIVVTNEGHHVVAVKKIKQRVSKPPAQESYFYSPSCRAASFFAVTPLRRDQQIRHEGSSVLSHSGSVRDGSNCNSQQSRTSCYRSNDQSGSTGEGNLVSSGINWMQTKESSDTHESSELSSLVQRQAASQQTISSGDYPNSATRYKQIGNCSAIAPEGSSREAPMTHKVLADDSLHRETTAKRAVELRRSDLISVKESRSPSNDVNRCYSEAMGTATTTADSVSSGGEQSSCFATTRGNREGTPAAGETSQPGIKSTQRATTKNEEGTGTMYRSDIAGVDVGGRGASSACSVVYKEIRALQKLNPHAHIVQMFDCFVDSGSRQLCIVTELMERSLLEVLESFHGNGMDEAAVRCLLYQALLAIEHVHKNGFIHRDIKPENFLVCSKGSILKLADFGCCRTVAQPPPYTEYIATRWYRPPECLMSPGYYSKQMDIWGLGCLMFELLTGRPLFPGRDETEQLDRIEQVLGPLPNKLIRRSSESVLLSLKSAQQNFGKASRLRGMLFPDCSSTAVDLMHGLLAYDPNTRMEPSSALLHPFFDSVRCPRLGGSKPPPLRCWEEACQLIDSSSAESSDTKSNSDLDNDDGTAYASSWGFRESDSTADIEPHSGQYVEYYSTTWTEVSSAAAASPSLVSSSSSSAITTVTPPPRAEASSPTDSPEATEGDSRLALAACNAGKSGRSPQDLTSRTQPY